MTEQLTSAKKKLRDWLKQNPQPQWEPKTAEEIAPEKAAAAKAVWENAKIGELMPDGSIFAGFTAAGKQQIYALPTDLDVTMTFNEAAKAVKKLNSTKALGHDDWHIPALENLRVLQKNQNEGFLKGTFKTAAASGSDYPGWYWSSTENCISSSSVHNVHFSDGYEDCNLKDGSRASCRPVRLVPAAAPSLG